MQNAFIESFNGSFRDELLNETLFSSLTEAREKITAWKEDYNRNRPHSSLGNLTPQEFAIEIETGNQGRMKPEINRRTLQTVGGKSGLRSAHLTPIFDAGKKPNPAHHLVASLDRTPI